MFSLYGRRWYEEYGETITVIWANELMSMTPTEAAMGWKACKESGDTHPVTLPLFLQRVSDALKAERRPPIYRAAPEERSSKVAPEAFTEASDNAEEKAGEVDIGRLARALGVNPRSIGVKGPRRSMLRGEIHPAGQFSLADLWKARGAAKSAGRSVQDMELELRAYNGWTPDDEKEYARNLAMCRMSVAEDSGDRTFSVAWES